MKLNIFKVILPVLCTALLLLPVSGCQQAENTSDSAASLELVDCPSTTLDNVWYNPGGIFRCALFESLLIADANMTQLEGALAKSYEVSEDELTYTFTLRENVTWHDGEAFDADDFIFSIKTALRISEINGLLSSAFLGIEGSGAYCSGLTDELKGVTADGNVLKIRLTAPNGNFLDAIAQFAVLPEHLLRGVDPEQLSSHEYWKTPIGCGPYRITDASEDEYFILEANKDYYGSKPGISRIRLRLNVEDCVTAMQQGTLDFYITNDPEEIAQLKGNENCSAHPLNILFPTYLIANISDDAGVNGSLKDVRVRKALLLAIDRKTITDVIFPGSSVTDTLVPSWSEQYWPDAEVYNYDPEKARTLLEEAGFDFSKTIRLRYSTKGQSTADLMNSIAVYWRAIGMNVDVEKFEGSGSEHMFEIRDYDLCYKRLSAFDHKSIYDEVLGDGVMQTSLFHQPVYDTYVSQLNATRDTVKRQELIYQMQALDQEYLFRIPLFALANIAYVNDTRFDIPEVYGNLWYRYNLKFEDWTLVN